MCFYRSYNSFWTCEVKRSLDKSLLRISAFSSLRTSLHTSLLQLVSIFFLWASFFSHLSFFPWVICIFSLTVHLSVFATILSTSPLTRHFLSTSSLSPASLCSLPSWGIVSMHEQACWWDQLFISSHKTIDLIPRHRDACTCTNTPLCSAALHCPGGLGEIRSSLCTP